MWANPTNSLVPMKLVILDLYDVIVKQRRIRKHNFLKTSWRCLGHLWLIQFVKKIPTPYTYIQTFFLYNLCFGLTNWMLYFYYLYIFLYGNDDDFCFIYICKWKCTIRNKYFTWLIMNWWKWFSFVIKLFQIYKNT